MTCGLLVVNVQLRVELRQPASQPPAVDVSRVCICPYMARPRVSARLAVCRPSQSTCFEHDVPGSAVAWYVGRTVLVSIPRSRTPHTHWGTASDTHTRRVPSPARARLALKVARCGGLPLIRCGAATPHNAALVAVNGCAQRSPGHARRRTPPPPHGYMWDCGNARARASRAVIRNPSGSPTAVHRVYGTG